MLGMTEAGPCRHAYTHSVIPTVSLITNVGDKVSGNPCWVFQFRTPAKGYGMTIGR